MCDPTGKMSFSRKYSTRTAYGREIIQRLLLTSPEDEEDSVRNVQPHQTLGESPDI